MLTVTQTSQIVGISPSRIKQILNDHKELLIHKEQANNGIVKIPPTTVRELLRLRGKDIKPKTVVIKSEKGGVGATTTMVQLAIRIAEARGARVLVIDADSESNATSFLASEDADFSEFKSLYEIFKDDITAKECIIPSRFPNVDILPARPLMRRLDKMVMTENPKTLLSKKLKPIQNDYDIIFIDLPPTYSRLSESAYITADLVILPADNSAFSIEGVVLTYEDIKDSCNQFETKEPEIRVIMTKFNGNKNSSKEAWNALTTQFPGIVLPITIRESADLINATNAGLSIYRAKCTTEVRSSFDELMDFVCPLIDKFEVKAQ